MNFRDFKLKSVIGRLLVYLVLCYSTEQILTMGPLKSSKLVLLALSVTIAACSQEHEVQNYFPTEEGIVWIYDVRESHAEERSTLRQLIYSESPKESEKVATGVLVSLNGSRDFYKSEKQGIYHLGTLPIGRSFSTDKMRKQMMLPRELFVGKSWRTVAETKLLKASGPWEKPIKISHPVPMENSVYSIQTNITLKAGKFINCVIISSEGKILMDGGEYLKYFEVKITERKWFAPNVGLIKYIRTESASNKHIGKATFSMDLKSWNNR